MLNYRIVPVYRVEEVEQDDRIRLIDTWLTEEAAASRISEPSRLVWEPLTGRRGLAPAINTAKCTDIQDYAAGIS
jgi:hypothetical protein